MIPGDELCKSCGILVEGYPGKLSIVSNLRQFGVELWNARQIGMNWDKLAEVYANLGWVWEG